MPERCDFYSDEEYQCVCILEQQAEEEYIAKLNEEYSLLSPTDTK